MKQKSPPRGGNHIWDGLRVFPNHIYRTMETTVSKPSQTSEATDPRVIRVGPSIAHEWLDYNEGNRNVNHSYVRRYAEMMQNGKWMLSPDAIAFDTKGRLINGQHRLLAVIKSGTSHEFYVVRGLQSEVFDRTDTGRPRNAGQILDIAGYENYRQLAAVIRLVMAFERFHHSEGYNDWHYSCEPSQALEFARYHGEALQDSANKAMKAYRDGSRLARPAVLGFIHYAMRFRDENKAWSFVYGVSTGLGVGSVNDARHRFRDRLIKEKSATTTLGRQMEMALISKSVNKYFKDEAVKQLSWREGAGESFPRPDVGPNYPFGFFE